MRKICILINKTQVYIKLFVKSYTYSMKSIQRVIECRTVEVRQKYR